MPQMIDPQVLAASLRRLSGTGHQGLQEALQQVVGAAVDVFAVTGSGLMLADEQDVLRYAVATDGPGRHLEQLQTDTGQGPCVDAFVYQTLVETDDAVADERWPADRSVLRELEIRAVLGIPVRVGGVVVGSLDLYRDRPGAWTQAEITGSARYGEVVEAAMQTALAAQQAGELAAQLDYALQHRVLIERAVGYLMGRDRLDGVMAFNVLRRAARDRRCKIGEVARELLETGHLHPHPR